MSRSMQIQHKPNETLPKILLRYSCSDFVSFGCRRSCFGPRRRCCCTAGSRGQKKKKKMLPFFSFHTKSFCTVRLPSPAFLFIMRQLLWMLLTATCHGFQLTKPVVLRFSQSKDTFRKIRSCPTSLMMRFVPLTARQWRIPSTKVQLVLVAHVVVIAATLTILRVLLIHLTKFVQETIKTKRLPKDRKTLEVYEKRRAEEQEKARLTAWKKRQEAEIVELRIRLQQLDEIPASTNVRVPNAAKKRELAAIADRKRQQAMILARPMDGVNAAKRQELSVIAQRKLQQDMMSRDHLSITREEEAEKNRKLTSMLTTAERDAKRLTESALADIKAKVADVVEQRLESEEKEEELRYAQEWTIAVTENTPETTEEELEEQREWNLANLINSYAKEQKQPQSVHMKKGEEEKANQQEKFQKDMDDRLSAEQMRELEAAKQQQQQQQQLQQQLQQQQQQQFLEERALEEKRAFEGYRQGRLDARKKQQENTALRWETARKALQQQQAEDERDQRQKNEGASMLDVYPLGIPFYEYTYSHFSH